jgi:hypothetical protein
VKIAGRCACGTVLEWAARNPFDHRLCSTDVVQADPFCPCGVLKAAAEKQPEKHMRCYGFRLCGKCGATARVGKDCRPCANRRSIEYQRRRGRIPVQKEKQREYDRKYRARQRRLGAAAYEREKAAKRRRYATDPAYATRQREAARRRHERHQVAA